MQKGGRKTFDKIKLKGNNDGSWGGGVLDQTLKRVHRLPARFKSMLKSLQLYNRVKYRGQNSTFRENKWVKIICLEKI